MPDREYDVAGLDDLDNSGMYPVDVDGKKILLIKHDSVVYAIDATCPHAGAPLATGIRHGNRLVCPWHKATFCIRTGDVLEPPALDSLTRYQLRINGGRVLLSDPHKGEAPGNIAIDTRCFVIVGAGAAGAVAAQTLRQAGFNGRLVMLDQVNRVPYDRTILSKYVLSGETGAEKSPLQSQSFYKQHRIERLMAEVTCVDPVRREVTCADGTVLRYDAALLATGSRPKRPNLPGAELENVFLLRSRSDADAILAQAERSERAVILGASFIGMEVAASLRERGLDVVVVGKEAAPFEKQLGNQVGGAFTLLHEKRGVSFRLGGGIKALVGDRQVHSVVLESGETLAADLVVIGFGVQPATSYLNGFALQKDGSILVDGNLRVTDGLYAAGDIARFALQGDGDPIRVEHWRVAQQQGRVAALNMLGQVTRYDAVPVFWTIQYLKRLDYIGHTAEWDDIIVHGDLEKPEFLAYYIKDGFIRAVAGMDRDQDTAALIELLTMRKDWTPSEMGDNPAGLLSTLAG